ncbi:hypothetical protein [Bradyrhizobium sp. SZCCHNR1047]|uniref:hypothetical protein n=1 Tax=Bradyrhizobium sp. SZCCHNR1047 TaxID=3057354 RepID=UPI0029164850|nr:hypothetical protein [Bradyrhizobium sp. SZCCHNR1047]
MAIDLPINGREPDRSEDDIQRDQLSPRGVPGKPDSARMTPQQRKQIPHDPTQVTLPDLENRIRLANYRRENHRHARRSACQRVLL